MRGISNKLAPHLDIQPLYRGTLNGYCSILEADKTRNNLANDQATKNTTLGIYTPKGILAGQVLAVKGEGTVGVADGKGTESIVGIAVRSSAGDAFESTNSEASGGITYLHGSSSVVEVPIFETMNAAGTAAVTYTFGDKLYASQNGLLTNAAGLSADGTAALTAGTLDVVGIVLETNKSRATLTVQLRV